MSFEKKIRWLLDNCVVLKNQQKRIDGEWEYRYVWECGDLCSRWKGYKSLDKCVDNAYKNLTDG